MNHGIYIWSLPDSTKDMDTLGCGEHLERPKVINLIFAQSIMGNFIL